ncbi:MAG TPA: hypothetical protein VM597_07220 [Gemmataceae bacterium]|nr:hypothetical protein [Gemmataceae bacterium]
MGARQKLNQLAFLGCAVVAAVVGSIAQSWWIFGVVLVVTLAAALANSDIRLRLAHRRTRRRPTYR